ncbi:MAG: hypothetical protein K1X64_02025 [Myxococcaceae bacterium]|nr:hypothetical protein [Myxococcaceae bacterium]
MSDSRRFWLAVNMVLVSGCFTSTPLKYAARPERIDNPRQEVLALIAANTSPGCVADASFQKKVLLVKYVCHSAIGNTTARLDEVKSVTLEKSGEWYVARVKHSNGAADFVWTSKSRRDAERLVDALTALSGGKSRRYAPDSNATKI